MRLPIMSVQRKKRVEPRDGILKAIIQERRNKQRRKITRQEGKQRRGMARTQKKAARRNYFTCYKEKGELEKSI